MTIEDNFLDQKEFDKLQTFMMGSEMIWNYSPYIVHESEKEFQFEHNFYNMMCPTSTFIERINSILEIIIPKSLIRIKANLLTRTSNIIEHEYHVDLVNFSEEKLKQWTTAIFYVNTNNGYTKFEDGTKVESVANRMVTFSSNMKHTGTSCTDEKVRIVINFNYFK